MVVRLASSEGSSGYAGVFLDSYCVGFVVP